MADVKEFKLDNLPITGDYYIVLKPELRKELIENAARKFGFHRGHYCRLIKYLLERCRSLHRYKWETVRHSCSDWTRGYKTIPIDCLLELHKLTDVPIEKIENNILSIKTNVCKIEKILLEKLPTFNENDLGFLDKFYGIKIVEDDIKKFKNYVRLVKLLTKRYRLAEIRKILSVPKNSFNDWVHKGSLPKCVEALKNYFALGDAGKDLKWLSINLITWRFKGPWIKVPIKIEKFSDIVAVIEQLVPLPEAYENTKEFNLPLDLNERTKIFFYLLGVIVGDCGKERSSKSKIISKRIFLELAKSHESNLTFGNFVSFCTNALGLKMKKMKGRTRKINGKLHSFFAWSSQHSLLIEWITNVCLGLKEGETTTYTPINTDWLNNIPKDFRIAFLQGIYDSDGWVDLTNQQVGVVSGPNTQLMKHLLLSLDISSRETNQSPTNLIINIPDAFSLPVFNPIVRSYRYERLEKLARAKRLKRWPDWLRKKIDAFIASGSNTAKIVEKILDEDSIAIGGRNVMRRRRKNER